MKLLWRIACTVPVTSCENKRANNTLKNVKTALCSSMGQERLLALAKMSIHHDVNVWCNWVKE